jgi:hypothetical protein
MLYFRHAGIDYFRADLSEKPGILCWQNGPMRRRIFRFGTWLYLTLVSDIRQGTRI